MTFRHPFATLGAAAGACAAAAMISSAATPAAHADPVTDGVSAIESAANAAYSTAFADLASPATEAAGLTQLFVGLDDDFIGIPNFYEVALTDESAGVSVIPPADFEITSALPFDFSAPTSVAQSVTEAQTIYAEGATTLLGELNALPVTDVADAALYNAQSFIDEFILPGQIELIADLAYLF